MQKIPAYLSAGEVDGDGTHHARSLPLHASWILLLLLLVV